HRGAMETTTTQQARTSEPAPPTILSSDDVAELPELPLGNLAGVTLRILWQDGTSIAGVLTVEPGHHLGAHTHRVNHHHIWVLDGVARILGRELGPGSYVHIPAGVEHDIDASLTSGCRVLYMYLR